MGEKLERQWPQFLHDTRTKLHGLILTKFSLESYYWKHGASQIEYLSFLALRVLLSVDKVAVQL